MLKSSTSIVGLLLLACLLGSALALGTGMRQRRDPAQVRTKVLEFLKKSLLKAGHDDHEDHLLRCPMSHSRQRSQSLQSNLHRCWSP